MHQENADDQACDCRLSNEAGNDDGNEFCELRARRCTVAPGWHGAARCSAVHLDLALALLSLAPNPIDVERIAVQSYPQGIQCWRALAPPLRGRTGVATRRAAQLVIEWIIKGPAAPSPAPLPCRRPLACSAHRGQVAAARMTIPQTAVPTVLGGACSEPPAPVGSRRGPNQGAGSGASACLRRHRSSS